MATVELISREDNVARVRVALEPAEVDQGFKAVYRQLAGQINVPGFRKGKVPPNVLRQRVGVSAITGEVDDRLRDFAVNHAVDELKLMPRSGQPRFEGDAQPTEGSAHTYEFTLAVLPEVKLPDYRSFEVEVTRVELTDELRERYRRRLIERFTTATPKEGAAASGDFLSIDIHSKFADSGEDSPFHAHGAGYVIGREGNLPGWDEQLTGATAGSAVTFEYVMPTDFSDARVADKTLTLEIKVEAVQSVAEPELSEEFVKEKLGMESLQQFEEYMEDMLRREIEMQLDQTKKEAAMQRVTGGLQADISEDMIKDEIDGMIQTGDRELRAQGHSLDAYLTEKGQSIGEYRDSLREAAESKIRFFLAGKAIADAEDFTASQEDFSRYAYYLMQRENIPAEQMQELMKRREFFSEAAYQIVLEKVLNHLVDKVGFKVHGEEPPPPRAADVPAPDAPEQEVSESNPA